MKLIADTADIAAIKTLYDYFPIDGITTNPTILAKSGKPPFEVLHEIRDFIGQEADLHVQAVSAEAASMLHEADRIYQELGSNTFVKIPTTREGLKAMKELHKCNHPFTATAIYTPLQAFLAGNAGAAYAAPYVNRIDNLGANGIQTVKTISDIYRNNYIPTRILAASFKNAQQILELCAYGIDAATVAPDIIEVLISNDSVTAAVKKFSDDFEKLCGKGKTMENC